MRQTAVGSSLFFQVILVCKLFLLCFISINVVCGLIKVFCTYIIVNCVLINVSCGLIKVFCVLTIVSSGLINVNFALMKVFCVFIIVILLCVIVYLLSLIVNNL